MVQVPPFLSLFITDGLWGRECSGIPLILGECSGIEAAQRGRIGLNGLMLLPSMGAREFGAPG